MVETQTVRLDLASCADFKAAIAEAIEAFGEANGDLAGPSDAMLAVSFLAAALTEAAWRCAEQRGLTPAEFAQAAMVEALAPPRAQVIVAPEAQSPWPN